MPTLLITGANQGIGLEFTRQYAADGWHVIATCRTPDAAGELHAIAADTGNVDIEKLDVRDHAAIEALGGKLADVPLDVLINNAGIIGPVLTPEEMDKQHFGTMDYEVFREVIETNTFGPLKMAETFIGHLEAGEQKKLVNISSNVSSIAEMAIPGIAYATSKSALNREMTIVADQLRDRGIIVAMFCPGYTKTRMDMYGYATVEIVDSINGLRPLIEDLTLEHTGTLRDYTGRTIPW